MADSAEPSDDTSLCPVTEAPSSPPTCANHSQDTTPSGNQFKPDDSGIELEKSPGSKNSQTECDTNPVKCLLLPSPMTVTNECLLLNRSNDSESQCKPDPETMDSDILTTVVKQSILNESEHVECMDSETETCFDRLKEDPKEGVSCSEIETGANQSRPDTEVARCMISGKETGGNQSKQDQELAESMNSDTETGANPLIPDTDCAQSMDNENGACANRSKLDSAVDLESSTEDFVLRRRRRNRVLVESSSEEEEEDEDDNDADNSSHTSGPDEMETSRVAEEEKEEAVKADKQAELDLPHDTWRPLYDVLHRERGYNNRVYSSALLRERTGASVNLVRRLTLHKTLEHHEGCVNSLHFNMAGTLLASGSDDLNIVVWDWARGKPYFVFDSGHRSNVFQSKFMPYTGDSLIVSCARDGNVRLAELSSTGTCKGTKKLAQHKGAAHKLALLDDSSHVFYSCGEDAIVYELDLRQPKPNKLGITKENERKVPLYSIHTNPCKSHEYCVGGRDQYIRIYDKRMLQENEETNCLKKFCPHQLTMNDVKANVTCAVYNWNGTEVIGTYNDEDIYMFNTSHSDGANYIHRYRGHRNNATVKGVNFYGPQSEFIVSGSDCGNVFLWERETEKIVTFFHADAGGVINVLEPHPHNPFLATSGLDHDVKVFLPTRETPSTLDGLKQVTKRNLREREEERTVEPDMMDGHMMWVLLQHLRRSARSQAREDGAELTPSSSEEEDDNDDLDDSDEEGRPPHCVTS